jgi:hypothetical protein
MLNESSSHVHEALDNVTLQAGIDNIFQNISLYGVFFMTTGVALLEAGINRKKNL